MSLQLYNQSAFLCSQVITQNYSTSFSIGISFLDKTIHKHIYAIYGFVRVADEIVDTFHNFDKPQLLQNFKTQTFDAIQNKISTNPILHSFQQTVNTYNIDHTYIHIFLNSMQMDLDQKHYEPQKYKNYILGSAEVVGLMCLQIFTNNNAALFQHLKPFAMSLGAAFQKINFLRDLKQDWSLLGRSYFPNIQPQNLTPQQKKQIETEIKKDFHDALQGIKQLPQNCKLGVFIAYVYYYALFKKICHTSPKQLLQKRIRISNFQKIYWLLKALIHYPFL